MAGARLTYSVVGFLFFALTDTIFCVWDKITLWCNQKHCNIGRDKLQGNLVVPGAFCILKELLHYLMPKWANLCCSFGGWNFLQQLQMSQRKACDIFNCSLVLQSLPGPCENDGVCYGSSIHSWSRTTIGAEADLQPLEQWNDSSSTSALLSEIQSVFYILWTDRNNQHTSLMLDSPITSKLQMSFFIVAFSMCLQRLGFAVQRKEIQFFLRVPLLA